MLRKHFLGSCLTLHVISYDKVKGIMNLTQKHIGNFEEGLNN
jgi:hypothetical protein